MYKKPQKKVILSALFVFSVVVAVIFYVGWLTGKNHTVESFSEQNAESVNSRQAQVLIDQLQISLCEAQSELEQARDAEIIAGFRSEALQRMLETEFVRSADDSSDLALYRRIENQESARLIEVESATLLGTSPYSFQVVLVNWQGRDRVEGELGLSLKFGPEADSESSADANSDPIGALVVDLEPVAFSFRFFQKLTVTVPCDTDFTTQTPKSVSFRIAVSDERLKSADRIIEWSELEILD